MKTQLLTISAIAMLFIGQSTMAFEQINNESGYDAAYQNGWVDSSSANSLDVFKSSYISNPSIGFEQINNESDFVSAYHNGWVSPEGVTALNLDIMTPSFRTGSVDMFGRFEDALSRNYLDNR